MPLTALKSINDLIEQNAQANNILDDLDDHTWETPRTLKQCVEDLERSMIQQALNLHNHNRTRAAKDLGISRELLFYKMKKYKIY